MTALARSQTLAPLFHLLTGALLGMGLVGTYLVWKPDHAADQPLEFRKIVYTTAVSWGTLGAVGGLIGGVAAEWRRQRFAPGIRFWMLALGAGGALTLGTIALRNASSVPANEGAGPAVLVLTWLIVGWLAGVLLGAVGSAFAHAATPAVTGTIDRTTTNLPRSSAHFLAAILSGATWAVLWGSFVALLALLAVGVVGLSVGTGSAGPALAVGGTCGCVFFGLRYLLFLQLRR